MLSQGLQAATNACDSGVVMSRSARQRKRSVTKQPTTQPQPAEKKRRFHSVTIGSVIEVSEGYYEKWQLVEEPPNRWGEIVRFRERLRDEDGFPTTKWVETGRHKSDNRMTLKFPVDEFPVLPPYIMMGVDKDGELKVISSTPKGTKTVSRPPIEWFRPVAPDHPDREAFVAKRTDWLGGLLVGKVTPKPPMPEPAEQWFLINIPDVAMQNHSWGSSEHDGDDYQPPDARSNFPDGWCCKLVSPQPQTKLVRGDGGFNQRMKPVQYDKDWAYVQFPVHYSVSYWMDDDGQWVLRWRQLTDKANRRAGKLECGMWIPRWLLKPVTPELAQPVYDWLMNEWARA